MMDDGPDEVDEKLINEDYKIWKKNTPFLYDVVITTALEWPSLSVDCITGGGQSPAGADYTIQKMVLGTHTAGDEQNYLLVSEVRLPKEDAEIDVRKYETHGDYGGFGVSGEGPKFTILARINHPSEVNRALHMPQDPFKIATKTTQGDVLLFDYSKHQSTPKDNTVCPQKTLKGHRKEGWGLAWNPFRKGYLLSGAEDARICVWDVEGGGTAASAAAASGGNASGAGPAAGVCEPVATFTGHANAVEDVAWSHANEHLFGSCSDDKKLMIWDMRTDNKEKPAHVVEAHQGEVNSLTFNAYSPFLIATGGTDHKVNIWDMRKLANRLHTMESHRGDILRVHFAPFNETILGSASADRRVNIWDLSRIGEEQSQQDAEDGPPELLFVHGGHTSKVSDFSWNPNEGCEWVVASVAEDNILQIWQPVRRTHNYGRQSGT